MIGSDQRFVSDLITFGMIISAVSSIYNYRLPASGITDGLELWGKRFAAFYSVVAFCYWTVNGVFLPLLLLAAPTQPATPLVEGKGRHSGEKHPAPPRWMRLTGPVALLANVCMAVSVFTIFRLLSGS